MRTSTTCALVLFAALALTGCSVATGESGSSTAGGPSSSSTPATAPSASATLPPLVNVPTPTVGNSPTPAGPSPTVDSSDPAILAIQTALRKANQAQQDAFEKNDPTIMKDTATSDYYKELVRINEEMAQGGISAIKLLKIEWGQIKLTSPTTARATTFETWQTTFRDGSTDQSRERNSYTLVKEQGAWKIQSDDIGDNLLIPPGGSPASNPSGSVTPNSPSTSAARGSRPAGHPGRDSGLPGGRTDRLVLHRLDL